MQDVLLQLEKHIGKTSANILKAKKFKAPEKRKEHHKMKFNTG